MRRKETREQRLQRLSVGLYVAVQHWIYAKDHNQEFATRINENVVRDMAKEISEELRPKRPNNIIPFPKR